MLASQAFRAMGSDAGVCVVAPEPLALVAHALDRIHTLEARWSRFRPGSELNRLNAAAGAPAVVSADTALLVSRMVQAWEATAGCYDPTLLDALESAGYADTWHAQRDRVAAPGPVAGRHPGRGCTGFAVDADTGLVALPAGVRIEPGGIGKGLAADIVTAELLDMGATGALVDLGGDVRVRGDDGHGEGWHIAVDDPHRPGADLAVVTLLDGAVATSSRLRRRWRTDGGYSHHLLDPHTGAPVAGTIDAVTVVAGDAWWAEALTKAAFVSGATDAVRAIAAGGAAGVVVEADGGVRGAGNWSAFTGSEVPA